MVERKLKNTLEPEKPAYGWINKDYMEIFVLQKEKKLIKRKWVG